LIVSLSRQHADKVIGERASKAIRKVAKDRSNDTTPIVETYRICRLNDRREYVVNVFAPASTPKRNEYNSVARAKVNGDKRTTNQYITGSLKRPDDPSAMYEHMIDLWIIACEELQNMNVPRHLWPRIPTKF
jgi:hypothetical protein